MAIDIGTGATVTFALTNFDYNLLSIEVESIQRPAIDTTHLTTSLNARTYVPGDLYDGGVTRLELQWDANLHTAQGPPILDNPDTITIDWASQGSWSASGFLTEFTTTVELESVITAQATFKMSGAWNFAA